MCKKEGRERIDKPGRRSLEVTEVKEGKRGNPKKGPLGSSWKISS
jgi:hypothetical protein